MNLNKILASSCRQKILVYLSKQKEATIMNLVRVLGSTYNEVNRNLNILEREGVITQQHFNHHRVIFLNTENNKTIALLNSLKALEIPSANRQPNSRNRPFQNEKLANPTNAQATKLSKITLKNIANDGDRLLVTRAKPQYEREPIPDCLTILSLSMPLRKTVVALYKTDKATVKDLSIENRRSIAEERAAANQLVKLGYIKRRKEGRKVYFYIEASLEQDCCSIL